MSNFKCKFEFGEMVLVHASIARATYYSGRATTRVWSRNKYFNPPKEAIFLKLVTLYEGKLGCLKHLKSKPSAWICFKGRKPERVLLEDIVKK